MPVDERSTLANADQAGGGKQKEISYLCEGSVSLASVLLTDIIKKIKIE